MFRSNYIFTFVILSFSHSGRFAPCSNGLASVQRILTGCSRCDCSSAADCSTFKQNRSMMVRLNLILPPFMAEINSFAVMMEEILDRKLLGALQPAMVLQVTASIQALRDEVATMKAEIISSAASSMQQQNEFKADLAALHELLTSYPVSLPVSSQSGTTLSSAAEFRDQPCPDEDGWSKLAQDGEQYPSDSEKWRPLGGLEGYEEAAARGWAGSPGWPVVDVQWQSPQPLAGLEVQCPTLMNLKSSAAESRQQDEDGSRVTVQRPHASAFSLLDRRSPALHRRHNAKSCMICRGVFKKTSSCKEHMLKCMKNNAACQFMPNCDTHLQLIRPFTGPTTEVRWISAVTEWIRRKE